MKTKIVEAQETTRTWWGKFLIGEFDSEWGRLSSVPEERFALLRSLGWDEGNVLVVDLSVGHGIILRPGPNASPVHDLEKRGIYFCPLMVPFLEWLYREGWKLTVGDLPDVVEVRTPKTGWLGPSETWGRYTPRYRDV